MPSVESCEKNQPLNMSIAQIDKNLARQNGDELFETMIPMKVYDSLIGELRCPSCARPMEVPIKLCETGHSVCNWCTKMLAKCPLCAKSFTEIRSLTLEALSAKAQFRCSNSSLGCPVRLQLNLLEKHEDRCAYQLGDCFMGKVWGGCKWHGREIDWIDHCELDHREKVFFGAEVTRTWELKRDREPKPISGYFIFRVFGETFNLYQIYDKPKNKMCWTMVCSSKEPNIAKRYSFEIELFLPSDESKISVQRNQCHGDRDAAILQEGRCAIYSLGEIMRFMDENRILHYRIKVLEKSESKRSSLSRLSLLATKDAKNRFFQADFTQTNIEGNNSKRIPSERIITRQSNSSSNNSSVRGSENGTPKTSSSPSSSSKESADSKESPKSTHKRSPIAGLKKILTSSSTNVFKPIKFGSRKDISISPTTPVESSTSPVSKSLDQPRKWQNVIKTDSIDKDIIENNDLKTIFVRSYNIDVTKIDDFLNKTTMSSSGVNTIPKPPRISLDIESANTSEMEALLKVKASPPAEFTTILKMPNGDSSIPLIMESAPAEIVSNGNGLALIINNGK